jgi:hypothetical protein
VQAVTCIEDVPRKLSEIGPTCYNRSLAEGEEFHPST